MAPKKPTKIRGESEAWLRGLNRAILDSALDCIITMDASGRVVEFNPAAERVFGFSREEAVGRELAELIIPVRLRERHRQRVKHYLETGEGPELGRRIEVDALRADGSEILVELAITAFRIQNEPAFTAYLRDITERKRGEEASQRLAAIVESSDDAIVSKDLDGRITSWNEAAERLFGYKPEEVIGQPITKLIPPDRHDEEPRILERIRRGERIDHYETVRRRKDGTLFDVSLTVSPIRDKSGRIIGASKFTPEHGAVTIRTSNPGPQSLKIEIIDTGIEPEHLEKVFDAFEQIGPRREGLGLGLAISNAIVEMHRGSIRAFSGGSGKGTKFVIDLATAQDAA